MLSSTEHRRQTADHRVARMQRPRFLGNRSTKEETNEDQEEPRRGHGGRACGRHGAGRLRFQQRRQRRRPEDRRRQGEDHHVARLLRSRRQDAGIHRRRLQQVPGQVRDRRPAAAMEHHRRDDGHQGHHRRRPGLRHHRCRQWPGLVHRRHLPVRLRFLRRQEQRHRRLPRQRRQADHLQHRRRGREVRRSDGLRADLRVVQHRHVEGRRPDRQGHSDHLGPAPRGRQEAHQVRRFAVRPRDGRLRLGRLHEGQRHRPVHHRRQGLHQLQGEQGLPAEDA